MHGVEFARPYEFRAAIHSWAGSPPFKNDPNPNGQSKCASSKFSRGEQLPSWQSKPSWRSLRCVHCGENSGSRALCSAANTPGREIADGGHCQRDVHQPLGCFAPKALLVAAPRPALDHATLDLRSTPDSGFEILARQLTLRWVWMRFAKVNGAKLLGYCGRVWTLLSAGFGAPHRRHRPCPRGLSAELADALGSSVRTPDLPLLRPSATPTLRLTAG